ncbi:MAG: Thiol-disulfide isomerase [Myxococcaceae bacterium]|jgi:hypothetical protein|nr:Thiol-disulfide isomerase [Myxococcaceae bacterium]
MHRNRSIAVALLFTLSPAALGVAAFTAPRSASAQDDATTKAARARFQEGVDFYDKKNYESARAAFLQAYALRKHPAVLLNLAQSCLRSGHAAEAVRYFQQFLRESATITPAQRTDAESGIAEARGKLGRLEISAPTAAEITVDGAVVGNAPLPEAVDVEPGSHTIKARMTDGTIDTKTVGANAGDKIPVKFAPPSTATVAPLPPAPPPSAPATPQTTSTTTTETTEPAASNVVTPEAPVAKKGILSPPKTMFPVYIGGALVVIGVADAIIFGLAKTNAQDSANQVANDIKKNNGGPGVCASTNANDQRKFGAACTALKDNNSKVDTDATLANIGIGVAIGGVVLAAGWYLFAPKKDADTAALRNGPRLTPLIGGDLKGAAFSSSF